jgi:uncharacterized protein (DUF1778 family)
MPLKPRDRVVTFRLTPDELKQLVKAARAAGMTVSEWCRARCVPEAKKTPGGN